MSSRRFQSVKPMLHAKLAHDPVDVISNPTNSPLIPNKKHSGGNRGAGLENNADGEERVFTYQAGHHRQLSQSQFLAPGPLYARVLLDVQPNVPGVTLRLGSGRSHII